jgi:hypothetical protein
MCDGIQIKSSVAAHVAELPFVSREHAVNTDKNGPTIAPVHVDKFFERQSGIQAQSG